MTIAHELDPQELLARYMSGDYPPRLNQSECTAIYSYFGEQNLDLRAGAAGRLTVDQLVILAARDLTFNDLRRLGEAVVGPHILAGRYLPSAVGLWLPTDQLA